MRFVLIALALLAQASAGFAQGVTTLGAGSSAKAAAVAGYQGPGDVVSGALAWWGLRCYSAAYTGKVAEIWDASTGTTSNTTMSCATGGVITFSTSTGCTAGGATCQPLATTCSVA